LLLLLLLFRPQVCFWTFSVFPLTGSVIGEALSSHPLVRKVGFTGSTPVGKTIMQRSAACNCIIALTVSSSALDVIFNEMCYINLRFTYLLTYIVIVIIVIVIHRLLQHYHSLYLMVKRLKLSIAFHGNPSQRYEAGVTCHMGSHSVTCHLSTRHK